MLTVKIPKGIVLGTVICVMMFCFCHGKAYPEDIGRDTVSVLFTGDIMLDRGVGRVIRYKSPDSLFTPSVDSLFRTADVVVGNLECPATDIFSPLHKRFVFRASPSLLPVLKRHGITHLNLANNHSIDHGREGLKDTRCRIAAAGIMPVGYGDNAREAAAPLFVEGGPRDIYILSSLRVMSENYVYMPDRPCVCEAGIRELCDTVRAVRQRSPDACVIVSLHWGIEHTLSPMVEQRIEARRLIDSGADAVVGHHSHTVQDVEVYRGKPVFYSLGNFIFDLDRPINRRGLVARLIITRTGIGFQAIPVTIGNCRPHVAETGGDSPALTYR
ncbi:CapA family protein [Xylanibacter muris]|uniref:CapA family protein n=1 Tax=Xylanibacter muris TaxID=2736290 RepID=A0ABX2AL44_9BACT|nr:CapA family protein [Xylanibacter muris]NPD90929.1 CapA family protein [Xylanibacter muris]